MPRDVITQFISEEIYISLAEANEIMNETEGLIRSRLESEYDSNHDEFEESNENSKHNSHDHSSGVYSSSENGCVVEVIRDSQPIYLVYFCGAFVFATSNPTFAASMLIALEDKLTKEMIYDKEEESTDEPSL